jgi:hypothetical protein
MCLSEGRAASEAPAIADQMQVDGVKGKGKESTSTREDHPAAVSRISKRPSIAATGSLLPNESIARTPVNRLPTSGVLPSHRESIATPFLTALASSSSNSHNAAIQETLNYDQDELETEQLLHSPKKANQRSARKRIMSDDEQEVEAPALQSNREHRRSAHPSSPVTAKTPKQERVAPSNKRTRTPPAPAENNYSFTVGKYRLVYGVTILILICNSFFCHARARRQYRESLGDLFNYGRLRRRERDLLVYLQDEGQTHCS